MKNRYTVAALIIFCGHTPAWTADTHPIYGAWKADFTKFTQSPPNQLAIHLEANACEITSSIGTPPQKYRLGAASEGGRPTMRLVDARTLELTRQTNGQPIGTVTDTVSEDGQQLVQVTSSRVKLPLVHILVHKSKDAGTLIPATFMRVTVAG